MHEHIHKTETSNYTLLYTSAKIDEVATHTVLGVAIDNNLSWTNHVNEFNQTYFEKAIPTLKT